MIQLPGGSLVQIGQNTPEIPIRNRILQLRPNSTLFAAEISFQFAQQNRKLKPYLSDNRRRKHRIQYRITPQRPKLKIAIFSQPEKPQ